MVVPSLEVSLSSGLSHNLRSWEYHLLCVTRIRFGEGGILRSNVSGK